jgi:hypothetical protein
MKDIWIDDKSQIPYRIIDIYGRIECGIIDIQGRTFVIEINYFFNLLKTYTAK